MCAVASFHVATFPLRRSISRLLTVPAERWELTNADGCVLGKVLGTSREHTTRTSIDLRRWAMFAVWRDAEARHTFLDTSVALARWRAGATVMQHFMLEPVASRGSWTGIDPFPDLAAPADTTTVDDGPVAVLTRASVRLRKIPTFTRAIGAVDDDVRAQPGCTLAMGIGELPVGQQATFSVWDAAASVQAFAHQGDAHSNVIHRTYREHWYREELFCRFRVTDAD